MRSRNIAGLVLAGAAALAACSSGTGGYGTTTPATKAATTPSATNMASATKAVAVSRTALGDALVDSNGRTLYGFTNDQNGTSTCSGTCAQIWPALTVSAGWMPGAGVAGAHLHTVMRADGQLQLAAGKWPLYTFTGDSAPGDVNGQGSAGFFVVRPDGSLNKGTTPR